MGALINERVWFHVADCTGSDFRFDVRIVCAGEINKHHPAGLEHT